MRKLVLIGAILACGSLQDLVGQQTLPGQGLIQISPGERIRVSAPDCGFVGTGGELQGVVGDSLHISRKGRHLTCALSAVERIEVRHRSRRFTRGTALGAGIGGLGGAALGGAISPGGAAVGLVSGLALGAAVGTGPYARSAALKGLGVGLVGGAALGAALGAGDDYWGPGFWAIVFGVLGAPVGALTGSTIGLLRGEERWVPLGAQSTRPQLVVTPDGRVAVGLTVPIGR